MDYLFLAVISMIVGFVIGLAVKIFDHRSSEELKDVVKEIKKDQNKEDSK
jgi:uncharacterized membrane-anchored protein YhcB (DUF1043 family)